LNKCMGGTVIGTLDIDIIANVDKFILDCQCLAIAMIWHP
jgi:hypothetical protein